MASNKLVAAACVAVFLPLAAAAQTAPEAPAATTPETQPPAATTPAAPAPVTQAPAATATATEAPAATATSEMPVAVAQKFCDTHLPGTAESEKATMELLTPSLRVAMDEAQKKSNDWEAAHPGEKPPLGDGVPFQSYPDVAEKCVAGAVSADGTEVDIEYKFDDPLANWTDRVKLAAVDGKLLIDDVFYGVNGFDESLRSALAGVGKDVTIEE